MKVVDWLFLFNTWWCPLVFTKGHIPWNENVGQLDDISSLDALGVQFPVLPVTKMIHCLFAYSVFFGEMMIYLTSVAHKRYDNDLVYVFLNGWYSEDAPGNYF